MPGPSRSLLRHPDFLKLWTAETVSVFGSAITQLALPLIAATYLQVTPFEFALLTTIEFLPFILLSLPAGVWVDRLRRRPILIVADLGRAVTIASIPIAFYFEALTIWQLYLVGFINGGFSVRSRRKTPGTEVSASTRRSTTSRRRPSETLGTLSTSTS